MPAASGGGARAAATAATWWWRSAKIAWDAWLQLVARHVTLPRPRPAFGHGLVVSLAGLAPLPSAGDQATLRIPPRLIGCYHPSRQNTNTGTVTPAMYDDVFGGLLGPHPLTE